MSQPIRLFTGSINALAPPGFQIYKIALPQGLTTFDVLNDTPALLEIGFDDRPRDIHIPAIEYYYGIHAPGLDYHIGGVMRAGGFGFLTIACQLPTGASFQGSSNDVTIYGMAGDWPVVRKRGRLPSTNGAGSSQTLDSPPRGSPFV